MQRHAKYKAQPVIHLGEEQGREAEWNIFQEPAGPLVPFEEIPFEPVQVDAGPGLPDLAPIRSRPALDIDWLDLAARAVAGSLTLLEAIGRLVVAVVKALAWVIRAVAWLLVSLASFRPSSRAVPFDDCGQRPPAKTLEVEYFKIKYTEQ